MVTIYDLLEVDENATKQEIEKAYQRLLLEYHKDPNLSVQENQENEMILNKLKIAYDILSNDEKRKKYDNDLAKKRAEDLIKNVSTSNAIRNENNSENEKIKTTEKNDNINTTIEVSSNNSATNSKIVSENIFANQNNVEKVTTPRQEQFPDEYQDDEVSLSKEEQEKLRKAAQREFKNNLKKAQKAEEEYNQAYNEAYNNYLRKMGYNVKEPWTLKRVKNVVITLIVIVLVCVIAWMIPPVREILISIYEDNIIIKSVVDIFGMFINAILSIFKK